MTASLIDRPDGRHLLILERRFPHPIEKVWRAVTEPEHLSAWYPATIGFGVLQVGAQMTVDYGDGWTTTALINAVEPPHVFAFTERSLAEMEREGDSEIRIELATDGDGCRMTFSQVFDDRPAAGSYGAGWVGCFAVLDANLNGTDSGPDTSAAERHEEFVRQFGLDQGEIVVTESGWEIRFERQLMRQPIPNVWSALSGEPGPAVGNPVPGRLQIPGLVSGKIASVEPGVSLSYPWSSGDVPIGTILWALAGGPGGARIHLTVSGTGAHRALVTEAMTAAHNHLEAFVASLV